jgi:hypothetical protein
MVSKSYNLSFLFVTMLQLDKQECLAVATSFGIMLLFLRKALAHTINHIIPDG